MVLKWLVNINKRCNKNLKERKYNEYKTCKR